MKPLLGLALFSTASFALTPLPLSTSSRWILDAEGHRVKLRCINWAAHMETNTPEGLHKQSIGFIADFVQSQGFNCVRMTYSIDHALSPNIKVSDSFRAAAGAAGVSVDQTMGLFDRVAQANPTLVDATTRDVFEAAIGALWERGIMTILDNHVSRASWCCNIDDGNGWWDEGFGYNSGNSRYFKTKEWLDGLEAMAKWSASQPGVVGMGIRNEIREWLLQGWTNGRSDWYNFATQAALRIHGSNPDALILIGGTQSSTDLVHIKKSNLDFSAWKNKHVWEWHAYSFTVTFSVNFDDCNFLQNQYGFFDGFVLEQGKPYTAPLILSEFGFGMTGGSRADGLSDKDGRYFDCLKQYALSNDMEWAIWALQGTYYIREGIIEYDDSWGYMNADWTGARNPKIGELLGPMFAVTQGP
ncbi:glycoside hydrolase family 5 protein [Microdochium trichocladiopsis]|uniref:Glycoside hydrolase family 5 protein n=1 Tax=Microdochium trichocladiopsis TaxID=1682393 RepID=A0A9P8YK88_9PEZI|nr:glycoside hydrolase family 5 protein [Microdochium trichocladiopsis]KAH7040996.1 glycoside hydrolase family 5 protein [Microdochium trichocladiopsis]